MRKPGQQSAAPVATPAAATARPRPVTRRQVAAAAGVSLTTVTHALNPPPGARLHPTTVERVRRVARELGYRPSFVGRALVSGKTFTVGLLQPWYTSVYFSLYQGIMAGMTAAMEADDYHLLILFRSAEGRYLKLVQQGRVDGMFVLQSDLDTHHIEQITATGIPTVVVNRSYTPPANLPVGCVHADHAGLMRDAVGELVSTGCRSLLELIDTRTVEANMRMHDGFVEAVTQFAPQGVFSTTMNPVDPSFQVQLRNALCAGQRWDGVFTDGVAGAEGFLEEAVAAGLRPGHDFRLITSDIVDGQTTRTRQERAAYTQQPELLGREAWLLLRRLIAGEATDRTVRVPYRRYAVAAAAKA